MGFSDDIKQHVSGGCWWSVKKGSSPQPPPVEVFNGHNILVDPAWLLYSGEVRRGLKTVSCPPPFNPRLTVLEGRQDQALSLVLAFIPGFIRSAPTPPAQLSDRTPHPHGMRGPKPLVQLVECRVLGSADVTLRQQRFRRLTEEISHPLLQCWFTVPK
ncbi:hypothetical protein [Deinococcus humi]|uniref:Uncharacterized protein n=1 Tax=Deinococcus humi TaxID=662880 RepID=A0A7W8JUS6_9DEIO|nr:hypothetical protein [Deinococcus humi]MBB5363612.1 hypothetical protein [Deinococcus humi]